MFKDLIAKNRSYRRFYEEEAISDAQLETLVSYARLSPSGANLQPLKFVLVNDKKTNAEVFSTLAWAGYLPDWAGPEAGERPSAYIVILQDKNISQNPGVDHGIAAQSMLLGAVEMGFGGCILGNIQRPKLKALLNLGEEYDILLVVALGKPKEEVVIDEIEEGQSVKYWRDDKQVHHVPKRKLANLIVNRK